MATESVVELGMSPKMVEVGTKLTLPGEQLIDAFHRLQAEGGMSIDRIAKFSTVNHHLVREMMKKVGYSPLNANVLRSKTHKDNWADGKKAEELKRKIHTPESDAKRSASLAKHHQQHPRGHEISTGRMQQLFGSDPKAILERLYLREGFTAAGITNLVLQSRGREVSASFVYDCIHRLGIRTKTGSEMRRYRKPRGGIITRENRDLVEEARARGLLDGLTEKMIIVLRRRYLTSGRPTFKQLAEEYNVTGQAINKSESVALRKIRALILAKD